MKLILTGSIAIDRIMVYEGKFSDVIQPDKIHQLSLSVLLKALKDTPGGVAANIGYTLALLGAHPVLYGSIGDDAPATAYLDRLTKLGIDTSLTNRSTLPTATFTVMTDLANCQIGGFYPGAMSDAKSLFLKRFTDDDFIVLSPHDPDMMRTQVAECAEFKKRMFYDIGQQVSNVSPEDLQAGISAAELLIVNDYEMEVLTKKTGWSKAEIESKVKISIITLGADGCAITQDGKTFTVPAVKVDTVVDPTGAGDAFRGGFLFGYSTGESLQKCAQLGSTAAAFCIEHQGAQGHTFTTEEFFTRYQNNYKEETHV